MGDLCCLCNNIDFRLRVHRGRVRYVGGRQKENHRQLEGTAMEGEKL